ncbi:hypothetical protein CHGG_06241 [Chaetomium globosum CBS 148.51]|uniref:Rho-GAP domain-containing protein n=1 Tax=Chaetomium globosum (strain ATCC 6205 / CBS 148.51 / DSM 1962 / NBRC 6347 / NRRL 1970) TaxID=306901 RepID=Q2H524_CHAGB|nr:uncharacterized protein CHGG_06241 [Chaetomium globosum CBS 148.51]EAQ89622.1 hypothetical protein CHGG_06241 [Chaetomium globosum CBS 148.51]
MSLPEAAATAPENGSTTQQPAAPPLSEETRAQVQDVLTSEIGISVMLNRLKQSIASAKDNMQRGEHRGGTFGRAYEEMMAVHERMADNGIQFAMSLHTMSEDLTELALVADKSRKGWKQSGLAAEQRVVDLEAALRKSKTKYDGLAEEYDRVRTGDSAGRPGGKMFGFKAHKSGAGHEEDLLRKAQVAEQDYQGKVQVASSERSELETKTRPETVQALQDILLETSNRPPTNTGPPPTQNTPQQPPPTSVQPPPAGIFQGSRSSTFSDAPTGPPNQGPTGHSYNQSMGSLPMLGGPPPPSQPQHERSFSHGSTMNQGSSPAGQQYRNAGAPQHQAQSSVSRFDGSFSSATSQGPPQLGALSFQSPQPQQSQQPPYAQLPSQKGNPPPNAFPQPSAMAPPQAHRQSPPAASQMAPPRPVFGVTLSKLYERDGLAVPMVVYQCIQAVDLFGLNVEGIYRLSGSVPHVNKLKNQFDTESTTWRLLKQPKTKTTLSAGDTLQAIINNLPDPNYATLRALTLHLHRVMDNWSANRMSSQNLTIVLSPTLMSTAPGSNISDAGWQVRVMDTILQNTYQIFDDDD